jgi:hypothetical protein
MKRALAPPFGDLNSQVCTRVFALLQRQRTVHTECQGPAAVPKGISDMDSSSDEALLDEALEARWSEKLTKNEEAFATALKGLSDEELLPHCDVKLDLSFSEQKLPFQDTLLERCICCPPKKASFLVTDPMLLAWLKRGMDHLVISNGLLCYLIGWDANARGLTESVVAVLKAWKNHVVDDKERRMFIEEGFSLDERASSDTIDCTMTLCFNVKRTNGDLPHDSFDATAMTAAKLVADNAQKGSP